MKKTTFAIWSIMLILIVEMLFFPWTYWHEFGIHTNTFSLAFEITRPFLIDFLLVFYLLKFRFFDSFFQNWVFAVLIQFLACFLGFFLCNGLESFIFWYKGTTYSGLIGDYWSYIIGLFLSVLYDIAGHALLLAGALFLLKNGKWSGEK
jgi:hypothetical protein